MLKRLMGAASLAVMLSATDAAGAVIFLENFNNENGGAPAQNYSAFTNFMVTDGTVDLIGNGSFEFPPVTDGHGLYVDLDGSTSDAGLMLANPIPVSPGDYTLFFQLAGNQRNGGNDVVQIRLLLDGTLIYDPPGNILVPEDNGFLGYLIPFTVTAAGDFTFSFQNDGGDDVGALLDNIRIEQVRSAPEPASMLLLGAAVTVGLVRRRR